MSNQKFVDNSVVTMQSNQQLYSEIFHPFSDGNFRTLQLLCNCKLQRTFS